MAEFQTGKNNTVVYLQNFLQHYAEFPFLNRNHFDSPMTKLYNAIPLHFTKLIGHRTAVNIQIIGKLLAAKWDFKTFTPVASCLIGQVTEKSSPDGF